VDRTDQLLYGAARIYIARLWFVIALWSVNIDGTCGCGNPSCGSAGKHPDPRACPHGFKDASVDPARIAAWFDPSHPGYLPNSNIGIVPGLSGLVIVDVDPRNGGEDSLRELEEAAVWREVDLTTRTVTTGSRGWHLYYQAPPNVPVRSRTNLLPGIDVKASDGFVVAPPSATKRVYEFRDHTATIAPLPEFLLEMIQQAPGARGRTGSPGATLAHQIDLKALLAGETRVPVGMRESTFFRLASRLRSQNVPYEEAVLTCGHIYERQADDHATFRPEDVVNKVRSVYDRYEADELTEWQRAWVRSVTNRQVQ
jgi:hypothetical protein